MPEASFFYSADTPAMAGPVSAFFFMYYMQELYSILSFDLAGNGEKSPDSPPAPYQREAVKVIRDGRGKPTREEAEPVGETE